MKYKLPLATINHSWLDRIKLASFFINPKNQWSMGPRVKQVEKELAEKSGYKYCVATSSGSTANTLLAMWLKESQPKRKILVSSVGWSTTITPFIRENFEPIFVDVEENFPVMDSKLLEKTILENRDDIAGVFYTTLLGIRDGHHCCGNLEHLHNIKEICETYNVKLYIDSCEDTLGIFEEKFWSQFPRYNYYKVEAETTSFYLAHEFQACPEMGAIFTNDQQQYEFYLMARNHGMIRSLEEKSSYKNNLVNEKFDFAVTGNNFRPNEISAYAVSLDLKRNHKFRVEVCKKFYFGGSSKIHSYFTDSMFALPIVIKKEHEQNAKYLIDKIKEIAENMGIETRPIVGGNLLRQTCFQNYGNYKDYPNAEWFHNYGIYVGLYKRMNKKLLFKFKNEIAKL